MPWQECINDLRKLNLEKYSFENNDVFRLKKVEVIKQPQAHMSKDELVLYNENIYKLSNLYLNLN